MKAQYFLAALFVTSLYWMYLLYLPFILTITIAILLAVSTASLQNLLEKKLKSRIIASIISTFLLAALFFAPLGYFLTNMTIELNHLDRQTYVNVETYIKNFIASPPEYLNFLKPYSQEFIDGLDISFLTSNGLVITGKIGAFSASFLKNAFLIIIFYFFAQYNGAVIIGFIKRILQISVEESSTLIKELTSVMSVVFYSILITAIFEGFLFGLVISFMGYNGLLFGIMYGFASLIPIVGGLVMWLPFALYELSIGNDTNALFIAIYSIVVISVIADTFIKPLIIKAINKKLLKDDDAKMNEIVIFFSIMAGLSTYGFWGMILGPAITALFLTILKLFEARTKECEAKDSQNKGISNVEV